MSDCNRRIVIDSDFFQKITTNDNGEMLKKLMSEYNAIPVMHEYVANKELDNNTKAQKLINEGFIKIIYYDDAEFLNKDEFFEENYKNAFIDAFKFCNGEEPDLSKCSLRDYRKAKHNMGEIHSSIMALYLRLEIFMSDDNGAKQYVKQKINTERFKLKVLNLKDTFLEIAKKTNKSITYKEFKEATKGQKIIKKDDKDKIKSAWIYSDKEK